MQNVLIIGGIPSLVGKSSYIVQSMPCDGLGDIHQLYHFPSMNGKPLFFQEKHLMPLQDPKSAQLLVDEIFEGAV